MKSISKDELNIFDEQKAAFRFLFETVNLDDVVFVGGVADYLNIRDHFELPVHDIDISYYNDQVIEDLSQKISLEKHNSRFYDCDSYEVHIGKFYIGKKRVHFDLFRPNFSYCGIATSELLGRTVQHSCFDTMRRLHNDHISQFTSKATAQDYNWNRLYKHSRKAGLYNLITYRKEKGTNEIKESLHV